MSDILAQPSLLHVDEHMAILRFESMKVVSAVAAVAHLLETRRISPGTTLVDSSSGIYAMALAYAAHRYGLGCHIVASSMVDPVTEVQIRALGASLDRVESAGSLKLDQQTRVTKVLDYIREHPDAYWMQQYHDPIHCLGYEKVAATLNFPSRIREVWLVGAIGSGASTAGIARGLSHRFTVRVAGVQPFGSITFGSEHVPDPDMIIAGIGSAIPFRNVQKELYETIDWIGYEAAVVATYRMYRHIGLFAGLSSGCTYLVADRVLLPMANDDVMILAVAPDTGHRYASAILETMKRTKLTYEGLEAKNIDSLSDLALPWSRAQWSEMGKSG